MLALLAASASCSSSNSDAAPSTANPADPYDAARDKCVATINSYRATLSLPPVTRWKEQEICSDGEADSDSQTGKAHGAFGTCGEMAQNECPGWPGPPDKLIEGCLKMMWDEGPGTDFKTHGHYINMSNKDYTKVACGFHQMPTGAFWAVQNFK